MHPDVPRIQCFQNFYIEISNKSTSSPQTTETTRKTKMTIDTTNFQNLCISIFKTSFKKLLSVIKWKRFLIKRNLYYQTIKTLCRNLDVFYLYSPWQLIIRTFPPSIKIFISVKMSPANTGCNIFKISA